MTLSFVAHLRKRLASDPPKQKGLRTRERLKIATATVLEEKGYHAMRVTDVSEAAGVAEGSFYVYFKDKTEAALTVLTELLEDFFRMHMERSGGESAYEAIREANRLWIDLSRANSGLTRCIFQIGDEEPDFARLSQRTNRIWHERVAASVARKHRPARPEMILFIVYMLGAMMDELVRKLIVYPDPELASTLTALKMNDRAVADAASLVWLRILHPDAPLPVGLPDSIAELARSIMPEPALPAASSPSAVGRGR